LVVRYVRDYGPLLSFSLSDRERYFVNDYFPVVLRGLLHTAVDLTSEKHPG